MFEFEVKQIKEYTDKLHTAITQRDQTIAELKSAGFEQFKPFVKQTGWNSYKGIKEETKWYTTTRPYDTPELAQKALDTAYENVKQIDKQNEEISKFNTAIYNKIIALLESCGLQKTTQQKKSPRSSKYITAKAEWYQAILSCMPNRDYSYYSSEQNYNRRKKEIDDWKESIKINEEIKKKEEEQRIADRAKNINLASLITKYNLPTDIDECDILDEILNKCKYLKLAHYLSLNRGDWSDGPEYAEIGLSGFTTDTQQDKEIYDEISGLIEDWDGDGRCFRDCDYNYGVLFSMVDEELYKDYEKAVKLSGVHNY